uniref:Myb/SANT-like DNA-binding domain-containing protein n=1 Tax=Chrysolophus pictus TaxID=9089 RepID=A0A8C3LRD4_CHRPC
MSHVRPVQLGNPPPAVETSKTPAFIPTVANEGGKHWTVNEVRALIHIWSDKNIQQQLEGTVRNKRIFEQVAARLQKFGIDRDWKQCRTKYKNLKHEYKSIKNGQDSGSTSRSMKFFNELDAILGHGTMERASKSDNEESERPPEWTEAKSGKDSIEIPGDTGEEDSVSNLSEDLQVADVKKVSDSEILEDEEDFSNSTLAALEATQIKKETIDIDDDSISSTSEDRSCTPLAKQTVGTVSVGDVTANTGSLGIKRKTWNDEMSPIPLKKSASENTIFQFQKLLTERVNTVTEGKKLLLERLCKREEMQDLNRTQLYAHPSAVQQGYYSARSSECPI